MNLSESFSSMSIQLLDNEVLTWALLSCGIAQVSKLIVELIKKGQWRPQVLVETGGMPSSHSALVTATASGVGMQLGFDHSGFALAATVAFVVMYDASGIRRSSGLTAARLNQLPDEVWTTPPELPLKETLGHSRLEVLVGGLMGPAIALPGMVFAGSPLQWLQIMGLSLG